MQPFIGQIIPVGFNFAPVGWLPCNGQLLPISEFETLFNLIGTTYGGDGMTTFALPNLQGTVVVGAGHATGLSPYVVGQTGGSENVALNPSHVPVHNHAMGASAATATANTPGNTMVPAASATSGVPYSTSAPGTPMAPNAVTPNNGGQPHANVQPVLCINYIIATAGLYPLQG